MPTSPAALAAFDRIRELDDDTLRDVAMLVINDRRLSKAFRCDLSPWLALGGRGPFTDEEFSIIEDRQTVSIAETARKNNIDRDRVCYVWNKYQKHLAKLEEFQRRIDQEERDC